MESKVCRICGESKLLTEYCYIKKTQKYEARCKECRSEYGKTYGKKNKEKIKEQKKEYYIKNKEKIDKRNKEYSENNKEKENKRKREYRKKSIKRKEYEKEYYKKNIEKIKEYRNRPEVILKKRESNRKNAPKRRENASKKRRNNPSLRLNQNTSVAINQSLKSKNLSKNGRHWEDLVGYTIQELKDHLEKLFLPGMTWDNYGRKKGIRCWEIDHILPVDFFEFTSTDDVEFKYLWSLGNLQPLWRKDNREKSNKIKWGGG